MIKRIVGLALLVAALGVPVMAYAATAESCPSGCPCCPCPGGCAYCSVAKVPCCHANVSVVEPTPSLEQGGAETALLIPPAHSGELIRPPKA